MKIKLIISTLIICLALSNSVIGQSIPDFSTVKTDKGMMVLNNSKAQAFSFLVPGKNPSGQQNADGSLMISTDTGVAVIYFVKTSTFLDKKKTYTEAETLAAHRDQDIASQETAWKAKLVALEKGETFVKVANLTNKLFPTKLLPTISWIYTAPKPNNTDRTLYQTVVLGDTILMLAAVFPTDIKPEEVRTFFTQTLESLTLLPPQKVTAKSKPSKRPLKKD